MQPPEGDFVGALLRRVRLAVADAEDAVRRSETLVSARRLLRERRLLKRCAWCGRVSVGGEWQTLEELPRFVPDHVRDRATHGICPACVRRLEREGKSHTR